MRHDVPLHLRTQQYLGEQQPGQETRKRRTIRKSTRSGMSLQQRKQFLTVGEDPPEDTSVDRTAPPSEKSQEGFKPRRLRVSRIEKFKSSQADVAGDQTSMKDPAGSEDSSSLQTRPRKLRVSKLVRFTAGEGGTDTGMPSDVTPMKRVVSRRVRRSIKMKPLAEEAEEEEEGEEITRPIQKLRHSRRSIRHRTPQMIVEEPEDKEKENSSQSEAPPQIKPRKLRMSKLVKFQGGTAPGGRTRVSVRRVAKPETVTEEGEASGDEQSITRERHGIRVKVKSTYKEKYLNEFKEMADAEKEESGNLLKTRRTSQRRVVRPSMRNIQSLASRTRDFERAVESQEKEAEKEVIQVSSDLSKKKKALLEQDLDKKILKITPGGLSTVGLVKISVDAIGEEDAMIYTDDLLEEVLDDVAVGVKESSSITEVEESKENLIVEVKPVPKKRSQSPAKPPRRSPKKDDQKKLQDEKGETLMTEENLRKEEQERLKEEECLKKEEVECLQKEKEERHKVEEDECLQKEEEEHLQKEREGLKKVEEERLRKEEKRLQKEEEERLQKEEEECLQKQEEERLQKEEKECLQKEKEERLQREEKERLQREEEERLQKEEEERLKEEEEERLKKEEEERLQKEEKERLQKEEEERLQKEEEERLRKEEEEHLRKEEEERLQKEEEEHLRKEEEERLQKEEEECFRKEEEEPLKASNHAQNNPKSITEEQDEDDIASDEEDVEYIYVDEDGNEISAESDVEIVIDEDGNEVIVEYEDEEEIGSDEEVIYQDEDGNYVDADGNPVDYDSQEEEEEEEIGSDEEVLYLDEDGNYVDEDGNIVEYVEEEEEEEDSKAKPEAG